MLIKIKKYIEPTSENDAYWINHHINHIVECTKLKNSNKYAHHLKKSCCEVCISYNKSKINLYREEIEEVNFIHIWKEKDALRKAKTTKRT